MIYAFIWFAGFAVFSKISPMQHAIDELEKDVDKCNSVAAQSAELAMGWYLFSLFICKCQSAQFFMMLYIILFVCAMCFKLT